MYINRKTNTKKQRAYDFYNSFKWDKVSRPTFYYRVRLDEEGGREEKIRIKYKKQYHKRECAPKGRRAVEMTRYNEQPEPKASKNLFRNRLNSNYIKEEAILIGDKWTEAKKRKIPKQRPAPKSYTPIKTIPKPVDENDFKINVTLSKEEAKVFRKEYMKMIEQLERELTYTEEKTEVAGLNNKITQLRAELMCFNCYNPK